MSWDSLANFPAEQLLAFMMGALVLNFAPGQDVFFASACGIQGGPRAGALAGFGVGLGVICHVTMATVGLGALVAAHPGALVAIKYAGAAYWPFCRSSRARNMARSGSRSLGWG